MFGLVCVVAQLLESLRVRVVVGVHPRPRRLGGHELEAESAHPAPSGHLDRVELAARHPQRRMRLLQGLRHDIAHREVEPLAVVLPALLGEHRQHAPHRVFPYRALVAEPAIERMQLGDRARLADAHLDAPLAHEVERRHALGDTRGMVGRQLDDAVTEADVLGPLARRREEDLRRRRVRVLLEEVVLDLPRVVEAELVGELDLVERVLDQLDTRTRPPTVAGAAARRRCRTSRRTSPRSTGT